MARLLLALLLVLPLPGLAQQIFKTTDESGNIIFTDQPPPDATGVETVELQRTNRAPPPVVSRPPAALEAAEETDAEAVAYSARITDPANETTIPMGPGNFAVLAAVDPALRPGDALVLTIDGEAWGEPGQTASWQLTNIFRGAHDLTVSVIAPDGQQLAASEPVRVYVLRPSVNFRN
jgi:hypothetical protein